MRRAILALALLAAAGCGGRSESEPAVCGAIPMRASWGFYWEEPTRTDGGTVARAVISAGPEPCWPGGATPGINLQFVSGPGSFPYSGIGVTRNECGGCGSGCIVSTGFPADLVPGEWVFHGTMYCLGADGGYLTYPNDADLRVTLP